jgi:signal transduction histidine kinase
MLAVMGHPSSCPPARSGTTPGLGTRLLLVLLPTVTAIMVAYAIWTLAERQNTLEPAARTETQAYSIALSLAFEYALRDLKHENVEEILNQVSLAPTVYGVIVYDSAGNQTFASDSVRSATLPPRRILTRVLETGQPAGLEREIDERRVYSVLRAIHGRGDRVTGALEVAQPLSFIEAEKAEVRRHYLLNTVTLLIALALITLWLVRRVVTRPMEQMVRAAEAVGGGDLSYRIVEAGHARELGQLAREFNTMASRLEQARDTEGRQAQERIVLERRLRETEKLAAIGNLAAGVAHEIAAPLNVITGRAEMVLRKPDDDEVRGRNLRIIVQQTSRITTLVRNLLDFARRREPKYQTLRLADLMDGVMEFMEGELERGGIAVVREDASDVTFKGDPDLLHQVLVNIVINAMQAMEHTDGMKRLTVRGGLSPTDETVWLEIEDTGPGIPPGAESRLFEPFFTTKPQGTGLGLGVARGIVLEHLGQLEAANAPGGGALFRLTLPTVPPAGSSHA